MKWRLGSTENAGQLGDDFQMSQKPCVKSPSALQPLESTGVTSKSADGTARELDALTPTLVRVQGAN